MASQSREKKGPEVDDVSETDILMESPDVYDGWETDIFKEFDEVMKKHDYFDTNLRDCVEPEMVDLLDRPFNEKGDERKTLDVVDEVAIMPIFLPRRPRAEKFAILAVESYNTEKKKHLEFDRVYKANSIMTIFAEVYLFTIDVLDSCSIKRRFQSCVIRPFNKKKYEVLVWSFKPKPSNALVEEYYKSDENENEDGDGWETPTFKTWAPFSWDRLDYLRTLPYYKKEEEEEVMDLIKRHTSEVRNSKGFDVQTFPPPIYAWLHPLPNGGTPSKEDIDEAAKFALNVYNEKQDKKMIFSKVSKVHHCFEHYILESDFLYFITFEVVDTSTNEERTYLTNVVYTRDGAMIVRYFKLKPRREDNL